MKPKDLYLGSRRVKLLPFHLNTHEPTTLDISGNALRKEISHAKSPKQIDKCRDYGFV